MTSPLLPMTIRDTRLEFLRPGPLHNQLLSKLTPYVALCNEREASTCYLPLDHRELLSQVALLTRVPTTVDRHALLGRLGEQVGSLLAQSSALVATLNEQGDEQRLHHVRLLLSGHELSLLPFEAAVAAQGMPGAGQHLLLQRGAHTCITRELRRSTALRVDWTQPPRVLFIAASVPEYQPVPIEAHALALYRAVQPFLYVRSPDGEAGRELSQLITVLPDASLEEIHEVCKSADPPFTHVHILAHGLASDEVAGHRRFNLALRPQRGQGIHMVDGARLFEALCPTRTGGASPAPPTWVTLMTCNSGDVGSVLLPGGSLAHELHERGIPWVLASQFPLTFAGSVLAAESLYQPLFLGEDPRLVLSSLRSRLFAERNESIDWASLVAYAAVLPGFDAMVRDSRRLRAQEALAVLFNRAHRTPGQPSATPQAMQEHGAALAEYQRCLEQSRPAVSSTATRYQDCEIAGLLGSSHRNAAFLLHRDNPTLFRERLQLARQHYEEGARIYPDSPWCIVHALSLGVLLGEPLSVEWWATGYCAALRQLESREPIEQQWGRAALVELHLLALTLPTEEGTGAGGALQILSGLQYAHEQEAIRHNQHLNRLMAERPQKRDVIDKLRRQLDRYQQAAEILGLPREFLEAVARVADTCPRSPGAAPRTRRPSP